MITVAFLIGGVAGLLGTGATLLFTDLGWGMALTAYFIAGYGLPLTVLAATSIAKSPQYDLSITQMARR